MFGKIKKYRGRLIVLIIFFIFGVPLLIHTAYKIDIGVPYFIAEWSAGELLQYYAAVLTFISTSFLSFVALQYSIFAKKNDDKIQNKITARLKKYSIVELRCYSDTECTIKLIFENLCENLPEFALVKHAEVYRNYPLDKVDIPCYRKTFCSVRNEVDKNFSIEIHFFESPMELTDIVKLRKIVNDYRRGLLSKEEFLKLSRKYIVIKLGVYCGGVVTPFMVTTNLQLELENMEIVGGFHYVVADGDLYISSPVLETDYESKMLD